MSSWERLGKCDDWITPRYIFVALDCRFDLDVAAPKSGPRYVPCKHWIYENSLDKRWFGFVWMNPPFGGRNGLMPWLNKFIHHGNGIALVPDRTSAPWFQVAAPDMDAVLFLSPKVKFEREDGTLGKSPSTGTVLFGVGDKAVEVIAKASFLGWRAKP